MGQWSDAELESVETLMRKTLLIIVSDAVAAARIPRNSKKKYNVDLIHKGLTHQGIAIDKRKADKMIALMLWDAARGRDS